MDEVEQRLREASDNCIKAYETWGKSRKNLEAREALQEAVHELRKVAARLEIEVAVSERDEMAQRPIPIPPHRSSRRRPGEGNDLPDFILDRGPSMDEGNPGNEGDPPQPGSNGPSGGGRQRTGGRPGGMRRPHQHSSGQ
jgi:hypothetical protein